MKNLGIYGKKIVLVSHFLHPFGICESGLPSKITADFASALKKFGYDVVFIAPFYKFFKSPQQPKLEHFDTVSIIMDREKIEAKVHKTKVSNFDVFLIEEQSISNLNGCVKDLETGVYFPNNLRRFSIFSRTALEALKVVPFRPDIIHVFSHWSGVLPILLKTAYQYDNFFKDTRVIFTFENVSNLSTYPAEQYRFIGVDWKYFSYEYLEFFGKVNILKGGIVFSDCSTTFSETYLLELQKSQGSEGLDGFFKEKVSQGVIKAIPIYPDMSMVSPEKDIYLSKLRLNYSIDSLGNKKKVKEYLYKKFNMQLSQSQDILISFIGEISEQKGISLFYEVIGDFLSRENIKLIIVGKGDDLHEGVIKELQNLYPKNVGFLKTFDEETIYTTIAGSDMILFPSFLEPYEFLHIVAMKYGTVPVVRGTGILNDIVRDKINGFKFYEFIPSEFKEKLNEAISIFLENPKRWQKIQLQGMKEKFDLTQQVEKYVKEVYFPKQ